MIQSISSLIKIYIKNYKDLLFQIGMYYENIINKKFNDTYLVT